MSASAQDRPADRPVAFVDAAAVVPGLIVDARYAGSHNFVGRPIDGYEAPRCFLTKPAAEALAQVARDLAAQGLVVKAIPRLISACCSATATSRRGRAIRAARPSI
jgi:D-alanyl-D-alanine dipeptidase